MENNFLTKKQALDLKLINYNEPCIAFFRNNNFYLLDQTSETINTARNCDYINNNDNYWITTPLKSEFFNYVRKNYKLYYTIFPMEVSAGNQTGYRYKFDIFTNDQTFYYEDNSLLGYLNYNETENMLIDKMLKIMKKSDYKPLLTEPKLEDVKYGGGHYSCNKCGALHTGSTIHHCEYFNLNKNG